MPVHLSCQRIDELPQIAEKILLAFPECRVFAFFGEMGAGKTTLIHDLCRLLGVEEPTASPSFGLVHEYHGKEAMPVFHFDFYRIKNIREAFDIGYEEYFFSGNYCLIEWPEKIRELLPKDCVKIHIEVLDNGKSRTYTLDSD